MSVAFPLSAIVGQELLVESLLVNAVSPEIGGVLVRGERGTAKTTAVRGLAPLLPGDRGPLVELPLGATLDRLVGSLDLARALDGEHRYEPGLMVRAHRGILYVDEVNLLADHLVDALLDAAATGIVTVEREAVSATHEARFLLVGTMNPEEGELRPQLLDRFGLGVEVVTPADPDVRAEIVRRRLAFEGDPAGFTERFALDERATADRLADARRRLPAVRLPARELDRITRACAELAIDGVRGDIVTARTARALAALHGADEVDPDHVRRAAVLALAHRRRRDPLDGRAPDPESLRRALDDPPPEPPEPPQGDGAGGPEGSPNSPAPRERVDRPAPARLPESAVSLAGVGRGPAGRRGRGRGTGTGAIDSRPAEIDADDLAIVATLRHRLTCGQASPIRAHVRAGRESALLCLVVDASGSMSARRRAARVKGALLGLLRDAYARRDRVAVISFRAARAELTVVPGAPIERAAAALRDLPTGGRTPLAEGLAAAERLIRREAMRDATRRSIAVVLTDGRVADPDGAIARAAAALGRTADAVQIVDTEDGPVRVGMAAELAAAAGGCVHALERAA
ncbi:MAG: VWA domain-containing protein [Solirubrobacterales bacterium]|nr:VWA domain-containing protein [Solirubrobacterales bacterium]